MTKSFDRLKDKLWKKFLGKIKQRLFFYENSDQCLFFDILFLKKIHVQCIHTSFISKLKFSSNSWIFNQFYYNYHLSLAMHSNRRKSVTSMQWPHKKEKNTKIWFEWDYPFHLTFNLKILPGVYRNTAQDFLYKK